MTNQSFPNLTLSSMCSSEGPGEVIPSSELVSETASQQAPNLNFQDPPDPRRDLARLGSGLGFAALYGLALGARLGGASLVGHALAASAGLAAVGVLGMPSLFVLLALVNAPVSPAAMLSAGARALGAAGLVLAGLAPSAALLAVTIESPTAAAFVAQCGLLLSGAIGLYQLVSRVRGMFAGLPLGLRIKSNALLLAFCVFAVLLACRVWYALPILQVAR